MDDGKRWKEISLSDVVPWDVWAAGGEIYIMGTGGIERSHDRGDNWTLTGTGGCSDPNRLYVRHPSDVWVVHPDPSGETAVEFLHSIDHGASWSVASDAPPRDGFVDDGPDGRYRFAEGKVLRSLDDGHSWSPSSKTLHQVLDPYYDDERE